MGLEFLYKNGAQRMRDDIVGPLLLDNEYEQSDVQEVQQCLEYEYPAQKWSTLPVHHTSIPAEWSLCPQRFIDGKDLGRTVAWLQTEEWYPIPVRLSEIGAVIIQNVEGRLRREWYTIERVVAMIIDPFPWYEIESFAIALQEENLRLLPCKKPQGRLTYDFQEMRKATQNRTLDEMMRLEKRALVHTCDAPVLIDGRLESRYGGFDEMLTPVVGMIKGHHRDYLHKEGWRVYYSLRCGERTPAFLLKQKNIDVVSWYVRIDGTGGDLPNWGIVRLEIPAKFFEKLDKDWDYINRLSYLVCEYRCRDKSYERASVSLYPIQRAEESLGSLFTGADKIIQHFYKLTQL